MLVVPFERNLVWCKHLSRYRNGVQSFLKHLLNIDFRCSELFRPRLVPALTLIGEVAAPRNGFFTFVLDEKKHSGRAGIQTQNSCACEV